MTARAGRAPVLIAACLVGACQFDLDSVASPCEARTECQMGFACLSGRCAPEVFTAPSLQTSLMAPGSDQHPTATGDALELYFASERAGGFHIYRSTRLSRDDPWGPPGSVVELNSEYTDASPGITSDGLTIYLASSRPTPLGDISFNVWTSTRTSRADAWPSPVFVAELSAADDEFEPQPDDANLRIVLHRGSVNRDLYEATRRAIADPWGPLVALPSSVNTTSNERSPCLAGHDRELWFGSDRGNAPDVHDIYIATRLDDTAPFDSVSPVDSLNSQQNDNDPWISPDGHVVIFMSDRTGDAEIYEARR